MRSQLLLIRAGLTLAVVLSGAVSPLFFVRAQAPQPLREEDLYFYMLAICGDDPASRIDQWGKTYDAGNYQSAMANEFSRQAYRERTKSMLQTRVGSLSFATRFTAVFSGTLGEYSFSDRGFPLALTSYLRYTLAGTISTYGAQPATIVNRPDYRWFVPMAEAQASAYVQSHQDGRGQVDRKVLLSITYSLVKEGHKCQEGHRTDFGFRTYFHSIDVWDAKTPSVRLAALKPGTSPEQAKRDAPEKLRALISTLPELKGYFYAGPGGTPVPTLRVKSFDRNTGAVTAEIDLVGGQAPRNYDPPIGRDVNSHSSRAVGSVSGDSLELTATWSSTDAVFGGDLRKGMMRVVLRYDLVAHALVGVSYWGKEEVKLTFPVK